MQVHQVQPHGLLQYVIPIAIFLVIFTLRARRLTQVRPLKIQYLWVVPAIYLVVVVLVFYGRPPSPLGWGVAAVALLVGAALGWQRGKTMQIHVDPETQELRQRGSIWAIVFIVVLIALKTVAQTEGQALHFDVNMLLDALAALSLGVFAAQRIEMYLRAKSLLEAARSIRA